MSTVPGYRLLVNGIVQGVGFRPFIWQLAHQEQLTGTVFNDAEGVKVDLCCERSTAERFAERLLQEAPPLSRVDTLSIHPLELEPSDSFSISASQVGEVSTGCPPDAATCSACIDELFAPNNRRYQYPFINCTNCGPRLSIIRQIPYDRESTTMASFPLCETCQQEYDDPGNRRFHAQPNACVVCGPQVTLELPCGEVVDTDQPFSVLKDAIRRGEIIAIKGIGGVHLACDATNQIAVTELRNRKRRPHKALALMARDTSIISRYVELNQQSSELLSGAAAPVVILPRRNETEGDFRDIAQAVAPDTDKLGFMLPYSPLHWLLMANLDIPLVMTSGNRSGEPQAITNEQAREQLAGIADLLLLHNRPIQNRLDDSVVMPGSSVNQVLRRARGYAPTTFTLPLGFIAPSPMLALGGQLKSTLCFIKQNQAIITQHLGDLDDAATFDQYLATRELYQSLYDMTPSRVICDMHPEYQSTKYAMTLQEQGMTCEQVQHHHAHIAACMGDNGLPRETDPVLGICLDGTGYGTDGTLWGGEFLYGGYAKMERVASLKPFRLISGVQAIREPWRCLYAQLRQLYTAEDLQGMAGRFPHFGKPMCATFEKMLEMNVNSPLCSSVGRLFDAVAAALLPLTEQITYEGQAAIQLEKLAQRCSEKIAPYPFSIEQNHIDPAPFWQALLEDLDAGVKPEAIAQAFHAGLVNVLVEMTLKLQQKLGFSAVVLSGGVMQNMLVVEPLYQALCEQSLKVLVHQQLPANDGGISFGQALVCLARDAQ